MVKTLYSRRIGVMGGTFDPIHNGHLVLAEQVRTNYFLDEVIFIPVGIPPHKSTPMSAEKDHRLSMTKLAVASNKNFTISDIEIKRDDITYTIDTINTLKSTLNPDDTLFFITGADALLTLESWKNHRELFQSVHFIGATRPGTDIEAIEDAISRFSSMYNAKIDLCEITALAISSTEIRERVNRELSIKYLMPDAVVDYIDNHSLYKKHHPMYEQMHDYLQSSLSKSRFHHSMNTAKLCRSLALIHKEDHVLAEFAGLCHDIAKELKKDKIIHYIEKCNIYFDPCFQITPNLAHGEVGACILKEKFGIDDEILLDAVRWHTYGHKDMTNIAKIVYLADIAEPSRHFDGIEIIRHYLATDLNKALIESFNFTKLHLDKHKIPPHSYSLQMIESIGGLSIDD